MNKPNINPIHFVEGNFLEATEQFMVIQIPVVWDNKYGHINKHSLDVFEKFPYANSFKFPELLTIRPKLIRDAIINSGHKSHELYKLLHLKEGMIDIRGNGNDQRYIVNIFTQQFTNELLEKNKTDLSSLKNVNQVQFQRGLEEVGRIKNIQSIALHEHIGIQREVGNWNNYLKIIQAFANQFSKIKTVIYTAKTVEKLHV